MGSFGQFLRAHERGEVKNLYWVCGPNRFLVEETLDILRTTLAPTEWDYESLDASSVEDPWEPLLAWPMDFEKGRRVVVIRRVDDIADWDLFEKWAKTSKTAFTHLILVSDRDDLDSDAPYAKRLKLSARVVRCSDLSEDEAVKMILRVCPMQPSLAKRMVVRGGFKAAYDTAKKMRLLGLPPEDKVVNALMAKKPSSDFVTALVEMRKADALDALENMTQQDRLSAIALLDYRLENLTRINRAQRFGSKFREVVKETQLPAFVVKSLMPYSRYYDPIRARGCAVTLAYVDNWRYQDGAMEVLVALW